MTTKLDSMKALSDATMQRITSSRKNWMDYLDDAAWLYKYPFYDQLMIYAQRPDAKACASIDIWNDKMYCWVNRGAKGIALFFNAFFGSFVRFDSLPLAGHAR